MKSIKNATSFNKDTQTAGPLLGDPTILRIEDALTRMISYNAPGATPLYNRLSRMGVSFTQTGSLAFDASKMRAALSENRSAVETLFTTDDTGLGAHFSSVLDGLTDQYTGLITRKNKQYDDQIDVFQTQIDSLKDRLKKVQARLYSEFYNMEETLSRLQSQQTAIDNISTITLYNNGQKKSS